MKSSLISNISFTLLVLTILVLPLILAQGYQLTDEEKELIEKKKWGEIAKLPSDKKNEILDNFNSNEKSEMLAGIAKNNLLIRANERIDKDSGSNFKKLSSKAFEALRISAIEFKGFDNSQLKFKEGNIITDGKTSIGLENLPEKLKKLEYSEGSFSLTFEDGSEIKYSNGIIDKDLRYISEDIPSSKTDKGIISLKPNKGKITIDNNGKFIIEKEAQVKVGDRTFEKLKDSEEESSFSIDKDGGQFKGKNLMVKTNAAEISIKNMETDIIFNKRETTSEQYIRILGPPKISTDGEYLKDVRIKGKDITVNLLNENIPSEAVKVSVDGNNIIIKNGGDTLKVDGEKIYSKTRLSEAIVGMSLENEKSPNTEIKNNQGMKDPRGPSKTTASKKDSRGNKKNYVTKTLDEVIGKEVSEHFLIGDTAITTLNVNKGDVTNFLDQKDPVPEFSIQTEIIGDSAFITIDKVLDGQKTNSAKFRDIKNRPALSEKELDRLSGHITGLLKGVKTPLGTKITNYWFPKGGSDKPYIGIKLPNKKEKKYYIGNAYLNSYKKSVITGAYGLSKDKYKGLTGTWCRVIGIHTEKCGK
tara:strand:+ start:3917 stop:5674 length:1758 start_codon:yes stop_codon:yes gene_type:complete